MVACHPQWARIIELVRSGRIGELRSAVGTFSYYNVDPANVRNVREWGGGGLMDIGCYPIKTSRMVFGEEPVRVFGAMTRDARRGGVDALTSAILEYPSGHCVFTCSMQMQQQQSMRFYGTKGRIEPEIPFNATPGGTSRITIDDGRAVAELVGRPPGRGALWARTPSSRSRHNDIGILRGASRPTGASAADQGVRPTNPGDQFFMGFRSEARPLW